MKTASARWHTEPKGEVHQVLAGVFRTVRDETAWRVDAHEYHAGFYRASDAVGVKGTSRRNYEWSPATLPYNVCRGATDTLQAKIAKHRPLPQVLTQRGSWKNQKRARKMTQFLEGEFYRQRVYEKHAAAIVRDALVFGDGWLKVFVQGDEIRTERAHTWEIFIDEWDGGQDDPRNLYHCRAVDKGVLLENFGRTESGAMRASIKDAVDSAGKMTFLSDTDDDRDQSTVDRVDVIEAWHLPSGKKAKDGRHVIIVEGATLLDEPWEHDYFPFASLRYSDPIKGARGCGLIEQLEGYQYEINLASEKSSEQHKMSGVGILCADGNGIYDSNFRNGINILRHKNGGEKPSVFQMDLVNEHTRQRPRELTQDALNDSGLSQMSVQSEKPAGITAGIALQTLDDIETERFMIFGRAYETWNLEVARRLIDCAKIIAKKYGDMAVSVPMKGGLLELSWNDVYVEGELKVFPTSLLPQQLGARLEKLKDMWNTGIIDRATFLRHLDAPDLQAELDLETADRLVVDEMLERMLEADEEEGDDAYMPPSAYQQLLDEQGNPGWVPRRAQQKLNRASLDGADEYNLDLLRRFLKHVDSLIAKLKAEQAPVGAAPIGPPPGAAAPPPDLPGIGIPGAPAAPPMAA